MLERRTEPGGDQQRAELVAVQGGGVGLVVRPRPPDMRGRGVVQELFFDRVLAEPCDGAQPSCDGGPGAPANKRSRPPIGVGRSQIHINEGVLLRNRSLLGPIGAR